MLEKIHKVEECGEMEEPPSTTRPKKNLHLKVKSTNLDVELQKNLDLKENSINQYVGANLGGDVRRHGDDNYNI